MPQMLTRFFIGLLTIGLLVNCTSHQNKVSPVIDKGVLNLTKYPLDKHTIYSLKGEWKFYPSQFLISDSISQSLTYLKVPGSWNEALPETSFFTKGTGYGTYALRVWLPKKAPRLAINYMTVSTAMEIWLNGKKIAAAGKPGKTEVTSIPEFSTGHVSFDADTDTLDIFVHISNFHYIKGGLWDTFSLGSEDAISTHTFYEGIKDFFLIGALLLISLYFITMYFVSSFLDTPLYFGFVAILMVIRIFFTGNYYYTLFLNLPFESVIRIEFLSFYWCIPAFTMFSRRLFPLQISLRVTYQVLLISSVFTFLVLFLPTRFISYTAIPFQIFLIFYLCVGFYYYMKAFREKQDGSTLFLVGFIVLFLVVVNDILYSNNLIYTANLFYAGIIVFIFALAMAISKIFVSAFIRLEFSNRELIKKAEEIENKNQQLVQLNEELDAFVYRTSHDLRSPISSLLGLIELGKYSTSIEELKTYAGMGIKSLRRMDKIINDIISFSKNTHLNISSAEIQFAAIIEDVFEYYSSPDNRRVIQKSYSVEQDCPLYSDTTRLTYILGSLVSNATQYADFQKAEPFVKIKIHVSKNIATIECEDNGQGIETDAINKVFDMFYRGSESSTGAGLGLYIVKETIKKMNGSITLQSEFGQGTLIKVMIPNMTYKISLERKNNKDKIPTPL
jgi:signal transduction histidine kinase